jgi:hypothetical protein
MLHLLRRYKEAWTNKINVNRSKFENKVGADWIHLAQDRDQW